MGSNPTPSASPPAGGAPGNRCRQYARSPSRDRARTARRRSRASGSKGEGAACPLAAQARARRRPRARVRRGLAGGGSAPRGRDRAARRRAGRPARRGPRRGAAGAARRGRMERGGGREGGQTPSVGDTEILPEGESAATAVEEPEAPEPESTNGNPPVVPVASEPVLEMLAAREGVRGPDGEAAAEAPSRRRRVPYLVILASFVAAVIGGAAALVGSSEWGDDGGTNTLRDSGDGTRHFVPQLGGPLEAPFPSEPQSISCYSTALLNGPRHALQGARRAPADPPLQANRMGLEPGARSGAPPRRLGRRAGSGARQRRARLAADQPRTARLRGMVGPRGSLAADALRAPRRQGRPQVPDRRSAGGATPRR